MNINELEKLAKEWNRFDADNEYSQSFLELIAAYREAVAVLAMVFPEQGRAVVDAYTETCASVALETAKRLGVE